MLDRTLQYTSGLKYKIQFNMNEQQLAEGLKKLLGSMYSEYKKKEILKIVEDCLEFSNPVVESKWTTLKKDAKVVEGWKERQAEEKKAKENKAPTIQKTRFL